MAGTSKFQEFYWDVKNLKVWMTNTHHHVAGHTVVTLVRDVGGLQSHDPLHYGWNQ